MRNIFAMIFSAVVIIGAPAAVSASDISTVKTYYWSDSYYRQLEADSIRRGAAQQAQSQVNRGSQYQQGTYYQQGGYYLNNTGAPSLTLYDNNIVVAPGFFISQY